MTSQALFTEKENKTAWKTLHGCLPEFAKCFSKLRRDFPPSEELINDLNKFGCLLYGDKTSRNVNEYKHELFKPVKRSDDALPKARFPLDEFVCTTQRENKNSAT